MDTYYTQKQMIVRCDKKGNIIGQIEKWEAHRKGILHRAFTVLIVHKNKMVLQHRKHLAFDGVFDATISSHQIFKNGKLQTTEEAVYQTLTREWLLEKKDVTSYKNSGPVYYKARDPKSEFTEHEMCEIVTIKTKILPPPNFDFAYGYSLVTKDELLNKKSRTYSLLAPWVLKMIEEKKI